MQNGIIYDRGIYNKDLAIQIIQSRLIKEFGDTIKCDFDLFDFEAEYDSDITLEENYTIIKGQFSQLYQKRIDEKNNKEKEKEALQMLREESNGTDKIGLFGSQANYLIIGKKGSGKTALGFQIMETIHNVQKYKKAYTYRFPSPGALDNIPFRVKNVINLNQLYQLKDSVILVDEAHIHFSSMDKKINEDLRNLLSISRQNNTDFIFICHNSYFLNRSLYSFIDVKIIKEVNPQHWELERSYMKKLYEDVHVFGKENFFIDSDFERGTQSFIKPEWFNDDFSKAYATKCTQDNFFARFCTTLRGK